MMDPTRSLLLAKPHQSSDFVTASQVEQSDADDVKSVDAQQSKVTLPHDSATSSFDRINSLCLSFTREWEPDRSDVASYISRITPEERPVLLRNLLEYELRQRRQAGEAPSSQDYIAQLPPEYADLVRRVFLDASSVSIAAANEPTPTADMIARPAASRLGDYRLVRELGRGGMGAVFEAVHLGRGHRVALKTLPTVSADALHRFKREFRVLADVTHPNLVGLRTLENDGGQWFITLDLLDGCDFLAYVRPDGHLDEARLRAALAQLAAGVMALHARGVVHRDLKPGNVMVTASGRVVVLDFGLVGELGGETVSLAKTAGTPAYMAPEQAAGTAVGPPADWYAVGVMLYEALSGQRPFGGDAWRLMSDKQNYDAPPLPANSVMPADLSDLCSRLLARDPTARPDPLQIAGVVATDLPAASGPPGSSDQLIARESQLAALCDALTTTRRGREPVTAFVRGRSGEGKTSLAEAFLTPLRRDHSLVVLSGRCYDRESVPFKALDTLIDALTSYLRTLPEAAGTRLLPDDIGLLAEVFPVLRRCEVVAQAPRGRLDSIDQQQVRQRAFAALRLLLDRIGEHTPLVCFVDDLQWGDADSASALFEVLRPPAAPPVLFLGSYRSDEADTSPFLIEWAERQRQNGVDFKDLAVAVGPLSLNEATQLIINVVGRDDEVVRRRSVQFHAQAGGNPFLLTELAGCFDPDADAFHATDIHGVLARKLSELPPEAGPLLNTVSVSGQAIELTEAAQAAGLNEAPEAALTRMRKARLLRVVGAKVDTYHDRIRYAVLDRMPDESKQALHRQLAEVIERTTGGLADEQIAAAADRADMTGVPVLTRVYDLSYHFDAAGDQRRALAYALAAAAQARSQYANDVAAQQYAIAHRNVDQTINGVRFRIARGRGEALVLLGRYDEAGRELEAASALADCPYDIADICLLRGDMLFKIGLIAESQAHLIDGLKQLGVHVPDSRIGLLWSMFKESTIQIIHNLMPWRLHKRSLDANAELANHLLCRLEYVYYCSNTMYLLWASLVGLNQAERLPRSRALAFNYMCHANDMAVLGWHSRATHYYHAAIDLSKELNDEYGAAQSLNHFSLGCLGAARYEDTIEKATPGIVAFSKLGDLLEYHLAQFNCAAAHYGLGEHDRAIEIARLVFESSVRHGDNCCGPLALSLWARASHGHFPYDELVNCVSLFPGNHLAALNTRTAEGHWHLRAGRIPEALVAFDVAWEISRRNTYIVVYDSWVLNDLVMALRLNAETTEVRDPEAAQPIHKRWQKCAKWANRLSWFLPPERPRALRELSLVYEYNGRIKKAWKLAAKSCRIAEGQKAKYEHAQSLLVQGRLAKKLSKCEADDQIRTAEAEIARIEATVTGVIPPA